MSSLNLSAEAIKAKIQAAKENDCACNDCDSNCECGCLIMDIDCINKKTFFGRNSNFLNNRTDLFNSVNTFFLKHNLLTGNCFDRLCKAINGSKKRANELMDNEISAMDILLIDFPHWHKLINNNDFKLLYCKALELCYLTTTSIAMMNKDCLVGFANKDHNQTAISQKSADAMIMTWRGQIQTLYNYFVDCPFWESFSIQNGCKIQRDRCSQNCGCEANDSKMSFCYQKQIAIDQHHSPTKPNHKSNQSKGRGIDSLDIWENVAG